MRSTIRLLLLPLLLLASCSSIEDDPNYLRVTLTGVADDEVAHYETTEPGTRQDPVVDIPFNHGPPLVTKLRLETKDLRQGTTAQIHIREVTLR